MLLVYALPLGEQLATVLLVGEALILPGGEVEEIEEDGENAKEVEKGPPRGGTAVAFVPCLPFAASDEGLGRSPTPATI